MSDNSSTALKALKLVAENGHLDKYELSMLRHVTKDAKLWSAGANRGMVSDYKTFPGCKILAKKGLKNLLMWARENGCPWDYLTAQGAAEHGHLDLLKWAVLNGCPKPKALRKTAENGHVDIIKWAHDQGIPLEGFVCDVFAGSGKLNDLQWAIEKGYPWRQTCDLAAKGGHLEVLKWARSQGCPWDYRTAQKAAEHGHLDVLEWAVLNGCPKPRDWRAIAEKGHLHILKWAHDQDIPLGDFLCDTFASSGNLQGLQWAREHGYPWAFSTILNALNNRHYKVALWAIENGCEHHYLPDRVRNIIVDIASMEGQVRRW